MNIKSSFCKFGNGVKNKSPEILLVVGLASFVGSVVLSAKAGAKAKDILESEEKTVKEKVIDISFKYAPVVGLAAVGTTSVLMSHGIMKKRYSSLVAAYGTLTASFLEYRSRVKEAIGEDKEESLYYGTKAKTVSIEEEQEDGTVKKVKTKIDIREKNNLSPYAGRFNSRLTFGEEDPYYVDARIVGTQSYLNDQLVAYGHLYLNDARDQLGLEKDDAGQLVGWIYDPNCLKDGERDNKVEIIKKVIRVEQEDGSYEDQIWIDFNVDGVIFGKMSHDEYNTTIKEIGDKGLDVLKEEN